MSHLSESTRDPCLPDANLGNYLLFPTLGLTKITGDIAAQVVKQRPENRNIGGTPAAVAAKTCLDRCFGGHDKCQSAIIPSLPTRVLYVGEEEATLPNTPKQTEMPSARLHVSSAGQRAEYTALSYCWGGRQDIATTKSTIESYMREISPEELPPTIRDAIAVTRGLKVNYLWVDALCILQDGVSDRSHEIERMGDVFKNATVTIAAARSASAREEFLNSPDPSPSIQSFLFCSGTVGQSNRLGKVWLVQQIDHDHSKEPLAQRGWALQEYILSPRVLHCGSKGLTWHCQTEKSRGVLPHYVNYSVSGTRLPRYINERVHSHVYASAAQSTAQHSPSQAVIYSGPPKPLPSPRGTVNIEFWPDVKDYSSRKLTFAEDKLLAIAGVESEFNKLSPDTCLAGLWKQDINTATCMEAYYDDEPTRGC
jgi:hypothetical protein